MAEEAEATATITAATVEQRVKQFIAIRDQLAELEKKHDAEKAPWIETKSLLEGWLMAFIEKAGPGVSSVKTIAGTVGTTTRYTASVSDAKEFMDYVIANKAWDLIERRAAAGPVRDWMKANKAEVPGVNVSALKSISVRRPTKKAGGEDNKGANP